jgi:hypothetical protein
VLALCTNLEQIHCASRMENYLQITGGDFGSWIQRFGGRGREAGIDFSNDLNFRVAVKAWVRASVRGLRAGSVSGWWDVVEADEVDFLAAAVFGHLQQIENAEES